MASCTIADEVVVDHNEAPLDIHIVLAETSPGFNPTYDREELDNHHVSISIRPSKEFCVWSVKRIYNGLNLSEEESFCSYCEEKTECKLIECVSIPGINITQKDLLESESQYKTERTTTHLCKSCSTEILEAVEELIEQNTPEITLSKL